MLQEQWWVLVFSPKRACLAQARFTTTCQGFLLELSLKRRAFVLREGSSQQARGARLSKNALEP